jgi:DNA polymerase-4
MLSSVGLTCSVGIAPVRFLAKIASDRDKPDGLVVVEDIEEFLPSVLLREVSGVGPRSLARLGDLGLTRLVEVRGLGRERLEKMLGSFGEHLWDLAHGRDPAGVHPGREIKSVSHELTLENDSGDREQLKAYLLALSQKVSRRLRGYGLVGRTVSLKLKHHDHRLVTRSHTLNGTTDRTESIYRTAAGLLDAFSSPGPFRLIGVGVSGLQPVESGQIDLFVKEEGQRSGALEEAEDRLVARFGEGAITRGRALTLDPNGGKRHNKDT